MAQYQEPEPDSSALDPLPYPHSFMLLPPKTVTVNQVLYPPIILRVLVPSEMSGHGFTAHPYAMDGDDKVRRRILGGSVGFQGRFVDDYIPEAGGSSSSGGYGSGYVSVYFVLSGLTFTSVGSYKIRISINDTNLLWETGVSHIGEVETDFFDIIRRNTRRQVPNRREAAMMEYLRGAGPFHNMPASS